MAARKKPKKLAIEFDVTGLSKDEIGELELEAVVQGEETDGQGGKHYDGVTGYPDTPVLGTKIRKRGKRAFLVVTFDVAHLTRSQLDWLASQVMVQGEASDGHPDVNATSKLL